MALGRLDIPGVVLYNGTIYPGTYKGKPADVVTRVRGDRRVPGGQDHARRAVRGRERRLPGRRRVRRPVHGQHDGDGARVPRALARRASTASRPRTRRKDEAARQAGELVMDLVRHDIRPELDRDPRRRSRTRSRPSPRPAARPTPCSTCSRSPHEFGIPLTIDEFGEIADRTPLIADMRPGGRYAASDMYDAGGVGLVMRELLKRGPAPRRRDDGRRADDRADRRRHRRDAGPAGRRTRSRRRSSRSAA